MTNDVHPGGVQVQYILLDPSCSGSGIVSRLDHLIDAVAENELDGEPAAPNDSLSAVPSPNGKPAKQSKKSGKHKKGAEVVDGSANQSERLASLAQFQVQVILHAFKCMSVLPRPFIAPQCGVQDA